MSGEYLPFKNDVFDILLPVWILSNYNINTSEKSPGIRTYQLYEKMVLVNQLVSSETNGWRIKPVCLIISVLVWTEH